MRWEILTTSCLRTFPIHIYKFFIFYFSLIKFFKFQGGLAPSAHPINMPLVTVRINMVVNCFLGALGGGAEMAMACDYRLMCTERPTTVIRFIHGRLGIVPAWGTSGRLMAALGPRKAMDVLLESRPMDAANAMDVGLVDGTAASLADVAEWLTRKTRHDVNVIRAIKRTRQCYDGGVESPAAATLMERKIFAPLWGGTANREALNKFFEDKR